MLDAREVVAEIRGVNEEPLELEPLEGDEGL
jgi:hypothetical protein